MEKSNGQDSRLNPKSWHPVLSIVLGSLLGSGGSLGVIYATPIGQEITRPYPYTSIDAKLYETKTDARLEILEQHIGDSHPDRRGDFDRRITENTMQIAMMSINLNNMLSIVDKNSEKLDRLLERSN